MEATPERQPVCVSDGVNPARLITVGVGVLMAMKGSDYLGFGLALSFGLWWLLLPTTVLKFYTWFHRGRVRLPQPSGVGIAGGVWVSLVLAVLALFLMR